MIVHPLVLIGLGSVGESLARDLAATAVALDPDAPVARVPWTGDATAEARLESALGPVLRELLETGSVRSAAQGRVGLDVLLLADIAEVPPDWPARALDAVSAHLATSWGVLFPADAPAEQRAAWATVLISLPPLRGSDAERGLASLNALNAHRARSPHPLLSRALVLPSQTAAGQQSASAAAHSLRATAQGLFLSGLREADRVQQMLCHRPDDRFIVEVSTATAELPLARLRRYARWRVALDGLDALVHRAEHPTGDPARAEALVARLDSESLLQPFTEGDPAQRVRRHAATLSGAADRLPEDLRVGLIERDIDLKQRYKVLLGPATKPPPDRATDKPEHHEILRLLDREEAFALHEMDRRIERLLAEELEPATALEVLPHLERALVRAAHSLQEPLRPDPEPLPALDPPPPPTDPGRAALTATLEGRPRLLNLVPMTATLALVIGALTGLAVLALLSPEGAAQAADPATFSSGDAPDSQWGWVALLAGCATGPIVALLWLLAVLRGGSIALHDALTARRLELQELWRQGGGGQPGRQAAALLNVRHRRTAHALQRRLERASDRLSQARASLRIARDGARGELENLRITLGASPRHDDLSDLLGHPSPLHRPLLSPQAVAERLAQLRPVQEPDRLAQELLQRTWPRTGIMHDLPGANRGALEAACEATIPQLGAESLLTGAEVAGSVQQRLNAFVDQLSGGLAQGLDPRDENGDPLPSTQPWLALGPRTLRGAVEGRLQDRAVGCTAHWSASDVPWVVVMATWPGLDVASVARGAQ